jgi:predicted metal-dependent HD superfamily phosphohydrolase
MITINPSKTAEAKADACKAQAKQLLVDTDWSQNLDVAAVLTNKAAFDTYRAAVREIYFNPVAEPVWPERPEADWSQA